MYMPNAKTQRQEPNTTYIPLDGVGVGVGANANLKFCVGAKANLKGLRWLQDTNMLVSPTQKFGVGGIAQPQRPTPGILRCSGI